MKIVNSFWKLLMFFLLLMSFIVILNYLRESNDVSFWDYFYEQIPKLLCVSFVGSAIIGSTSMAGRVGKAFGKWLNP